MDNNKDLIEKYSNVLELIKDHKQHNNLSILFDIAIKYLKERYKDYDINIKISATYIIKELYLKNLISSDIQTINIIDDFINYTDKNYDSFIKEYDINDFNTNMIFIKNYINKILNNENNE